MRKLSVVGMVVLSLMLMSAGWRTDFDRAKADAKEKNRLILLTFTGSDWCVPCIRMEKEVFSKDTFTRYATCNLETVNADFPRLKKNDPGKAIYAQNKVLAEQYDKEGHFPFTVLLTADGKVLKTWDGYKGEKPEDLIGQIKSYANMRGPASN
jgi:thioredoxin-related protein